MGEENAAPRKTSGLAIASLILGLVGLLLCLGPIGGIPGLILGIIAIREINASRGEIGGRGVAIAGVITSGIAIVMIAFIGIMAGLLLPAMARAREMSRRAQCMSNLKQIGLALHMYSQDNNELFPNDGGGYSSAARAGEQPSESGAAVLGLLCPDYVSDPQLFSCPTTPATGIWSTPVDDSMVSYGYDQRHTATHPGDIAVASDEPPQGGGNSPNHFGDGQNVLFIDGHVKWCVTPDVGRFDGTASDDIFEKDDYPNARWDSWIVR